MAISDCLEIMRLWNLLKHKCQKKITAVSLAFLVSLLDVNFPCLLMCAFYAGIKEKKTLLKKDATIINYLSMSAMCMLCICIYVCMYVGFFIKINRLRKMLWLEKKRDGGGGGRERPDARKPELNLSLFSL